MNPQQDAASAAVPATAAAPHVIHVSDVETLYDEINSADNAGAQIVLEAGYYALTPIDATSTPRVNNGRLELQPDMTLSGVPGHPEAVVIDAVGLPLIGSGAVRTGRGSNTVEWLTVKDAATGQAGVDTGLFSTLVSQVRLANLIVKGNLRGIDIRNPAIAAGRSLQVELENNDVSLNQIELGIGIRFVNANTIGAHIQATMHGNNLHDNLVGLVAANLNSTGSTITVESHADHFDRNRVGAFLAAGNSNTAAQADGNALTFNAHGGTIRDNVGSAATGETGDLVALGGVANQSAHASNNTLHIGLWGTKLDQINAWGARTPDAAPAGTNNKVTITLHGVSRQAHDVPVPSKPAESAGTNTVEIVRSGPG